jgi:hypothetical protein
MGDPNGRSDAVEHFAKVRAMPDVVGLVFFAVCSCGWMGPHHPGVGIQIAVSRKNANADLARHVDGDDATC